MGGGTPSLRRVASSGDGPLAGVRLAAPRTRSSWLEHLILMEIQAHRSYRDLGYGILAAAAVSTFRALLAGWSAM